MEKELTDIEKAQALLAEDQKRKTDVAVKELQEFLAAWGTSHNCALTVKNSIGMNNEIKNELIVKLIS